MRSLPRAAFLLICLVCALSLGAPTSPVDLEEAAEAARAAAMAAVSAHREVFFGLLDADRILAGRIGQGVWNELTERQRERLRSPVRENFWKALSPGKSGSVQIAWSAAKETGTAVEVFLGIAIGQKILKTRWKLERGGNAWRVTDVVLTDPGISLAASTLARLGSRPVARRDRARAAWSEALPRCAGLAIVLLAVLLASPRLPPKRRIGLYLAAAVAALLFLVDGARAVSGAVSEHYALEMPPPRGTAEGESRAPVEYRYGLAARERGDEAGARETFRRALAEREPAPGAARELAALELAAGRYDEALDLVRRYRALAGTDPEALSLEAVILTNLGRPAEALASIEEARHLAAGGGLGAELEARIRARAGDAAGTIAALESLEREGRLDRRALRADPAYLTIATDPAWVRFLDEKPKANSEQPTVKIP